MTSGISSPDTLKKIQHVWSFHIWDLANSWESHMPVAELLEMNQVNTKPGWTTSCTESTPDLGGTRKALFSPLLHLPPTLKSPPPLVTLAGRHSCLHNARQLRNEKRAWHILLLIESSEVKGNKTPNPIRKSLPPLLMVRRPLLVDLTASHQKPREVLVLG